MKLKKEERCETEESEAVVRLTRPIRSDGTENDGGRGW